ncbi:AMP-binding protein [Aphelenchoides besseyi]|nr:AMP-binding protein [Aphelenchoides besseyi]
MFFLRTRCSVLVDNVFNPLFQDIRNTWQSDYLKMCTDSNRFQPSPLLNLSCHLVFNLHFFYLKLEILSKKPAVVRIHRFGGAKTTRQIYEAFKNSTDVENQTVEGHQYSAGYRGRVADGLWLEHQEEVIQPLYSRLQKTLRINPAVAENFLILGYNVFGHYAPHYDYLHEMHRSYDGGWFEFYGNRMATALFIVQTANRGGGTVFPQLQLTIQPEKALHCYRYRVKLEWIDVEVISRDPPILRYPQFLPNSLIADLLNYIDDINLHELELSTRGSTNVSLLDARVANGRYVKHDKSTSTTDLYNYAQRRIDAFDMHKADQFQILSYTEGGHVIPHFDYIRQSPDLERLGNRMATMKFVLDIADRGGGLIFPKNEILLNARPGDLIIWLNMNSNYERAEGSFHGTCPVIDGEKMEITMWIRSKGQELRYPCASTNQSFPLTPLIRPKLQFKNLLIYELDIIIQKWLDGEFDL